MLQTEGQGNSSSTIAATSQPAGRLSLQVLQEQSVARVPATASSAAESYICVLLSKLQFCEFGNSQQPSVVSGTFLILVHALQRFCSLWFLAVLFLIIPTEYTQPWQHTHSVQLCIWSDVNNRKSPSNQWRFNHQTRTNYQHLHIKIKKTGKQKGFCTLQSQGIIFFLLEVLIFNAVGRNPVSMSCLPVTTCFKEKSICSMMVFICTLISFDTGYQINNSSLLAIKFYDLLTLSLLYHDKECLWRGSLAL